MKDCKDCQCDGKSCLCKNGGECLCEKQVLPVKHDQQRALREAQEKGLFKGIHRR